jgi:HAD superfamily phosphoserine phosphatase-like hydrolase
VDISIYDMDRTITRGGTWTPWLLFWARREAPGRLLLAPLLLIGIAAYTMRAISRARLKELGHRLLMGRHIERGRLVAAADAYAETVLAENVHPGALAQIAADRAAGRRLVLATASNAYYVTSIARALGMDGVVATESRWVEDMLHHRLGGDNCYGDAKRVLIEAFLRRESLGDARLNFYSDHESDAPMFDLAEASGGTAFAANPSPRLRMMAAQRGWEIVEWGPTKARWFERA